MWGVPRISSRSGVICLLVLFLCVPSAEQLPATADEVDREFPPTHDAYVCIGEAFTNYHAGDIGFLSGNVVWGQWIEARGYDETLFVVAGCSFAIALIYAWSQRSIVLRWTTPGSRPPSGPTA